MSAIGERTAPIHLQEAVAQGRSRASLVPDLLMDARLIANNIAAGWHGRRRQGVGDQFWQFRPYVEGDAISRIDWRRSARDSQTFIRDREWEAAHTVWLWADRSASMLYRSDQSETSKEARALVLALALAELLSRAGERIAWPGLCPPFIARNGAERLATHLSHSQTDASKPDLSMVGRFSDIVLISDFLDVGQTQSWLGPLTQTNLRAHLIEVADPAEESFPYSGHTEFIDPVTGQRLSVGRAESLRQEYQLLYQARRSELIRWCQRLGWTYTIHHTDRPASEALLAVHSVLGMVAGEHM